MFKTGVRIKSVIPLQPKQSLYRRDLVVLTNLEEKALLFKLLEISNTPFKRDEFSLASWGLAKMG